MILEVERIKGKIEELMDTELDVIIGLTEKKRANYKCKIVETYRSLFLIEIDKGHDVVERHTFKYVDIITQNIVFTEVDFNTKPLE